MNEIAVFGNDLNPPGTHHLRIVEELARQFDSVYVVPSGPRPDKPITNDTRLIDRAVMADLTFGKIPKVVVELFDLESVTFTKAYQLEMRYASAGRVWHTVCADYIRGGGRGESLIQRLWSEGKSLWHKSHFAVILNPGEEVDPADLPPNHRIIRVDHHGSSAAIRNRVFQHESIDGMVIPSVASYILRHGVYRGSAPSADCIFCPGQPKFHLFADPRNKESRNLMELARPFSSPDFDMILVFGGDGTMLHAIRQHWRERKPFYGVNTGHLGFLLNQPPFSPFWMDERGLLLYQLPLLWVEAVTVEGEIRTALAFNDCWVERASGQTAWMSLSINGEEHIPKVVADGALVATAAGSTSYARAMGAPPVPFNIPVLILAGSNVLQPAFWRPAVLPQDSVVEIRTLDTVKRPLQCYIDGESQGLVQSMKVRCSNIACVELAFSRGHDPTAKLARIQFPK